MLLRQSPLYAIWPNTEHRNSETTEDPSKLSLEGSFGENLPSFVEEAHKHVRADIGFYLVYYVYVL